MDPGTGRAGADALNYGQLPMLPSRTVTGIGFPLLPAPQNLPGLSVGQASADAPCWPEWPCPPHRLTQLGTSLQPQVSLTRQGPGCNTSAGLVLGSQTQLEARRWAVRTVESGSGLRPGKMAPGHSAGGPVPPAPWCGPILASSTEEIMPRQEDSFSLDHSSSSPLLPSNRQTELWASGKMLYGFRSLSPLCS